MCRILFFLVTIAAAYGSGTLLSNPNEAKFKKDGNNLRALGGVQNTSYVTDLGMCFRACLKQRRGDLAACEGVNYDPVSKACEVCNQKDSKPSVEYGWEYWNITWPRGSICQDVITFEYPFELLSTRGNSQGMISKDAYTKSGESKVYYMDYYHNVNSMIIYPDQSNYVANTNGQTVTMPEYCCGSSWLVLGGHLFCQRCADEKTVGVYDIDTQTKVYTIYLSNVVDSETSASRTAGSCSYNWGGYSYIDVEADSTGIYLIWALSDCRISISKIHNETYAILETWHTEHSKSGRGQAFMICGKMYLVQDYSTKINYMNAIFDFNKRTIDTTPSLQFLSWGYNSHTHYDDRDKALFMWDSGRQLKVPVNLEDPVPEEQPICQAATGFNWPRVDITTSRGGDVRGLIAKDPLTPVGESAFYFIDGYNSVSTVSMYYTEAEYVSNTMNTNYNLPSTSCGGSNNIIGGKILYQTCSDFKVVRIFDLVARRDVTTISLVDVPDANGVTGTAASCSYQWGGTSVVDIEADETGLYIIWPRSGCDLSISKLTSYTDFTIAETWHTDVSKDGKGQAFMICGKCYLTDSYSKAVTTITTILDFASKTVDTSANIEFRNAGYNGHTHYDFRDKALYAYDSNKQWKVDVTF